MPFPHLDKLLELEVHYQLLVGIALQPQPRVADEQVRPGVGLVLVLAVAARLVKI